MTKCATPTIRGPHEELHAALSRAEQGRMSVPDSLHCRAVQQNERMNERLHLSSRQG